MTIRDDGWEPVPSAPVNDGWEPVPSAPVNDGWEPVPSASVNDGWEPVPVPDAPTVLPTAFLRGGQHEVTRLKEQDAAVDQANLEFRLKTLNANIGEGEARVTAGLAIDRGMSEMGAKGYFNAIFRPEVAARDEEARRAALREPTTAAQAAKDAEQLAAWKMERDQVTARLDEVRKAQANRVATMQAIQDVQAQNQGVMSRFAYGAGQGLPTAVAAIGMGPAALPLMEASSVVQEAGAGRLPETESGAGRILRAAGQAGAAKVAGAALDKVPWLEGTVGNTASRMAGRATNETVQNLAMETVQWMNGDPTAFTVESFGRGAAFLFANDIPNVLRAAKSGQLRQKLVDMGYDPKRAEVLSNSNDKLAPAIEAASSRLVMDRLKAQFGVEPRILEPNVIEATLPGGKRVVYDLRGKIEANRGTIRSMVARGDVTAEQGDALVKIVDEAVNSGKNESEEVLRLLELNKMKIPGRETAAATVKLSDGTEINADSLVQIDRGAAKYSDLNHENFHSLLTLSGYRDDLVKRYGDEEKVAIALEGQNATDEGLGAVRTLTRALAEIFTGTREEQATAREARKLALQLAKANEGGGSRGVQEEGQGQGQVVPAEVRPPEGPPPPAAALGSPAPDAVPAVTPPSEGARVKGETAPAPSEKAAEATITIRHEQTPLGVMAPYNLPEGDYRFKVERPKPTTIRLVPVDAEGNPTRLTDTRGQQVDAITIWDKSPEKAEARFKRDFKVSDTAPAPSEKAAELMTPEEWAQTKRDAMIADAEDTAAKHQGRSDDVLKPWIAKLRGAKGTEQVDTRQHRNTVFWSVDNGKPVSAAAVDDYGIKLPTGYVRDGDRYVFKGETATAPAPKGEKAGDARIRQDPPQVARPTVLESRVEVEVRPGEIKAGKGYAIPGAERLRVSVVPPYGNKSKGTASGWSVWVGNARVYANLPGGSMDTAEQAISVATPKLREIAKEIILEGDRYVFRGKPAPAPKGEKVGVAGPMVGQPVGAPVQGLDASPKVGRQNPQGLFSVRQEDPEAVARRDQEFSELKRRAKAGDKQAEAEAQRMVDEAAKVASDATAERGRRIMPDTGTTRGDVTLPLYRFVDGDVLRDPERGIHWTHNRNEMDKMASDSAGFIITAKHPGYDRVLDWDNPSDRPMMEREIGGYEYRDKVFPEVPIRPGKMDILSIVKVDADGNKTTIKSADPFTYRDDGTLIPLSERFNNQSSDIRYSVRNNNPEDPEEAQKMRKFGARVIAAVPGVLSEGQKLELLQNPDMYYKPLTGAERSEYYHSMPEAELSAIVSEGLARFQSLDDWDDVVGGAIHLMNQRRARGEDVSDLAARLARAPTAAGRLIQQYNDFKTSTPEGAVDAVEAVMRAAKARDLGIEKLLKGQVPVDSWGRKQAVPVLTHVQRQKLTQLAMVAQGARAQADEARALMMGAKSFDDMRAQALRADAADAELAQANRNFYTRAAELLPRRFVDMFRTTERGNVLAAPSHVNNIVNTLFNLPILFATRTIGATADALFTMAGRAAGKEMSRAMLQPSMDSVAWLRGIPSAWKKVPQAVLKGVVDSAELRDYQIGFHPLRAAVRLMTGDNLPKYTRDENGKQVFVPKKEQLKLLWEAFPITGMMPETNFRFLAAEDMLIKDPLKRGYMHHEWRLAKKKMNGKTVPFEVFMRNPPAEVAKRVNKQADQDVYQDATAIGNMLSHLSRAGLGTDSATLHWLNAIVFTPIAMFSRTPGSWFTRFVQFSPPVAALNMIRYAKRGNRAKAMESFGMMVVGHIMWTALAEAVKAGVVVGNPQDEREKELVKNTFGGYNRLNIDGYKRLLMGEDPSWRKGDRTMSLLLAGFPGMAMAILANGRSRYIQENTKTVGQTEQRKASVASLNYAQLALEGIPASGRSMLDYAMMKGSYNALNAIANGNYDTWMEGTFEAIASVPLPASMRNLSRSMMSHLPDMRGITEKTFMGDTKILGEAANVIKVRTHNEDGMALRRDHFGRRIPMTPEGENPYIYHMLSSAKTRAIRTPTQQDLEMVRLWSETGNTDHVPLPPNRKISMGDGMQDIELTPEQYEVYSAMRGQVFHKGVQMMMTSPQYKEMTNEQRIDTWKAAQDIASRASLPFIREYIREGNSGKFHEAYRRNFKQR